MRTCGHCGITEDLVKFHKYKTWNICIPCQREVWRKTARKRHETNWAHIYELREKWRSKNKEKLNKYWRDRRTKERLRYADSY